MSPKKPNSTTSPTGKKLVQARLHFKTVTPKSAASESTTVGSPKISAQASPNHNNKKKKLVDSSASSDAKQRKRKRSLASAADNARPAKVNKIGETKENIHTANREVILLSSDESNESNDGNVSSSNSVIDEKVKTSPPNDVKTPKATVRRKEDSSTNQTPNKSTPKNGTSQSSTKKRKATTPKSEVVDVDSETSPVKSPNFSIKLPLTKKRVSAKETSITTPKGKRPLKDADETSVVTETADTADFAKGVLSPNKTQSSEKTSPKKSKTPKKTPPVQMKTTPKKSPSPSTAVPLKDSPDKKTRMAKTPTTKISTAKKSPTKTPTAKTPSTKTPKSKESTTKQSPEETVVASSISTSEKNEKDNTSEESVNKLPDSTSNTKDVKSNNLDDKSKESIVLDDSTNNGAEPTTDSPSNMSISLDTSIDNIQFNADLSTPKRPIPNIAILTGSGRKLTPKQLQRKLETERKQKEKQLQKEDREKKRLEELEAKKREKEQKDHERKRKEEQKEEERKRKEEQKEEERKRKEEQKEEERKQKEEERKQKEEERKRKEEQKEEERKRKEEQKEEERRRREEEKQAKDDVEKKKNQKEAAAFTKFFVKQSGQKISSSVNGGDSNDATRLPNFMPFCVKEDMKLAPTVRRMFSENHRSRFDEIVKENVLQRNDLYIEQLKKGFTKIGRSGKTWTTDDCELILVEDELEGASAVIEEPKCKQKYRAKYFKFHENRRPAYYGTWRKSSTIIHPRKPFKTDEKFFDYEVDSDDEWEEEEPGESLHGSDDEKDKESDDDYDIDNEFFVPHGHLSDEEVLSGGEEDDEDNSPEAQKAKLKIVQMEFADEMKKKTEKIKPRLIGLVYQLPNGALPPSCVSAIGKMLQSRAMIFQGPTISLKKQESIAETIEAMETDDSKATANKRRNLSEGNVADLIRLVHFNTLSKEFLVKEFQAFVTKQSLSDDTNKVFANSTIRSHLQALAKYQPSPETQRRYSWYVSAEMREKYGLSELGFPNTWTYVLDKPKLKNKKKQTEVDTDMVDESTHNKPKFNISNFTKVLSQEEKLKNFQTSTKPQQKDSSNSSVTVKPITNGNTPKSSSAVNTQSTTAGSNSVTKKRVNLLMSVPRGEEIPTNTKNALISNFLNSTSKPTTSQTATANSTSDAHAKLENSASEIQIHTNTTTPAANPTPSDIVVLDDD